MAFRINQFIMLCICSSYDNSLSFSLSLFIIAISKQSFHSACSLFHNFNIVFFSFKLHWIMDSFGMVMYGTWMNVWPTNRLYRWNGGCKALHSMLYSDYDFCWYSLEIFCVKIIKEDIEEWLRIIIVVIQKNCTESVSAHEPFSNGENFRRLRSIENEWLRIYFISLRDGVDLNTRFHSQLLKRS